MLSVGDVLIGKIEHRCHDEDEADYHRDEAVLILFE